ncbi:DsrE family protein [Prochlorococcus marinus XMU1414]|uniref:DsrE family protein n=1 Tax=Prochlorococcus marinus XMU1424 TaxID=2774497 RepID=A0A9D9G4L1_PROMR|nr:DsrE family protein [Prochlorococcus marinus]MBO8228515.1 DsrE family protein [Prochlorococcus marinus XMU1414]MBW3046002.1 multidrug transporter [Prochlorococcus marinus str. MU1414]MCR8531713.1 DsrE family protein [Prochlorococcus marinus XMU1420]MCR8535442.1 DsrE family protein [Prochlorococcus marinus XMU1424]
MSVITDNTVLVHIYSGLESKNKITLGLLVALTAEKNDHKVTLFLAGDGVQILNCKKAGVIVGQGTGDLYEHLQNLKNSKITIYVSGMSAKSRGYDEKLLDGYTAEFVMPDVLVEESIKADSVLCY